MNDDLVFDDNVVEQLKASTPIAWALFNGFVTENQKPLEFVKHKFLIDIMADVDPDIVWMKSAQVGLSVASILKTFWVCKHMGMNVIYVLPTNNVVKDFVIPKVDSLVSSNPAIASIVSNDSVSLKKVGDRFIYYRGAFSEREAISISADLLVIDELDRCYEPGTEILTKEGWVKIEDVTLDTEVATKRPKQGNVVFKKPTRLIAKPSGGELLRFKGSQLNVAVTPDHMMYARVNGDTKFRFHQADTLIDKKFVFTNKFSTFKAKSKWHDTVRLKSMQIHRKQPGSSKLPAKQIYMKAKEYDAKAFYEFIGWYISEGNIVRPKNKMGKRRPNGVINISQKPSHQVKQIEDCIRKLGYEPKTYVSSITGVSSIQFTDMFLAYHLNKLGYSKDKYIPTNWLWKASLECCEILLNSLVAGDGDERNVYTTSSKRLADDVQVLAQRTGRTASIYTVKPDGYDMVYKVGIKTCTFRRFNKYKNSNAASTITREKYDGMVYCVDVPPYHTVFVRGKEYGEKLPIWSGNCTDFRVLQTYDSRLQASDWGWRWRFSNPSIPGAGVHGLYENSTQHHWFVKCHHCGHRSFMNYDIDPYYESHYVNEEQKIYACGKCHNDIGLDRGDGEWVAKYRDRNRKGYWISQLMAPWVDADYIIEKKYENSPEFFHNFVLGLPYQSADMMLDRQTILNAQAPRLLEYTDMVMGTDVGLKKHYVIGNSNGVMAYGDAMDWETLEAIFLAKNCRYWVIDANPDQTIPRKLIKKYPGKVFINFYIQDKKNIGMIRWLDGANRGVVHSDRTKIIDHIVSEIQNKDIKFRCEDLDEFIYHATNTYRVTETKDNGMSKSSWKVKEGKPDHLFHALIYWRIALSKTMTGSGMVITPNAPSTPKKGFITNQYTNKMMGFHIDLGKIAKDSDKDKKKGWFYR